MANETIRTKAKNKGVYLWEIAEELNIQDSALSRKLRRELSEQEQLIILEIIDRLASAKGEC